MNIFFCYVTYVVWIAFVHVCTVTYS